MKEWEIKYTALFSTIPEAYSAIYKLIEMTVEIEHMESFPIESLILVILASIVAFLIGRMTSKGREDNVRLQGELEESRKAFQDYRKLVNSHFRGAAQRVDALTESYRDVYKHLARGAQELCEKSEAPLLLDESKHIPVLSREAIERPAANRGKASAGPERENDSQPESDLEKASENSSKSGADTGDESDAKHTNRGKGQGADPADSETNLKDEPDAVVEEPVEPEAQKPEQKSTV